MTELSRRASWLLRVVFVVYTLGLLTATHWPGLAIHGPIDRTDLVIHVGVFFVWTCLLYSTGLVVSGERFGSGRINRRLVWTGVAGLAFAAFDEFTQPMFSRVFDPLDLAADSVGVLVACGVIWGWGKMKRD